MLRDGGRNGIMRARLIPVAIGTRIAKQAIDQDARARALIAVDHDTGGIGERRSHRLLYRLSFEAHIALAEYDALHAPPARHQLEAFAQERRVVGLALVVKEMDRCEIAFAALGRRQTTEAADRDRA